MIKSLILTLLKYYQFFLSPDHSFWAQGKGGYCKFHPTCSDYCKQCFESQGFWKATWLSVRRMIRCRPGVKGGLDLPPQKNQKGYEKGSHCFFCGDKKDS